MHERLKLLRKTMSQSSCALEDLEQLKRLLEREIDRLSPKEMLLLKDLRDICSKISRNKGRDSRQILQLSDLDEILSENNSELESRSSFFKLIRLLLDSSAIASLFRLRSLSAIKLFLEEIRKEVVDISSTSVGAWLIQRCGIEFSSDDVDRILRVIEDPKLSVVLPFSDKSLRDEVLSSTGCIKQELEKIRQRREALHLREGDGSSRSDNTIARQHTSSFIMDLQIFGRSDDIERIVNLLLSDDNNHPDSSDAISSYSSPYIIAVLGTGGVGKTSLVQHVYHDERISQHFGSSRGWVCVSNEPLDVIKITKQAVESFTGEQCDLSNLDPIQLQLKSWSDGRKFLLVLDDVWSADSEAWDAFKAPFASSARGSKILITTRRQLVAHFMQARHSYELSCLSSEHSESLFSFHAFGDSNSTRSSQELIDMGKGIAKKCNGLPLSLKLVGRLLRHETSKKKWRHVLTSNIWEIRGGDHILASLKLSYNYLPRHLKPCFTYWALFRKDEVVLKEELVRMWIVQGFVEADGSGGRQLEDTGMEYVDDLLSRSLLESHNEYTVKMHDHIHDLAQYLREVKSKKVDFDEFFYILGKARSLPTINPRVDHFRRLKFPVNITLSRRDIISCASLRNLPFSPEMFKGLRQLTLASSDQNLLETMGTLKFLKYLSLTSTVEELPQSICELYNLQVLDLRHCYRLERLPDSIGNLKNLRYLDIESTEIRELPLSARQIPNLRCRCSRYMK